MLPVQCKIVAQCNTGNGIKANADIRDEQNLICIEEYGCTNSDMHIYLLKNVVRMEGVTTSLAVITTGALRGPEASELD